MQEPGRRQQCLRPSSFRLLESLGQRQPVLPRLAALETSRPHPPARLGPNLVDRADKPVAFITPELRAVAVLHRHVEPALQLGQGFGRDRSPGVFRQDGDVAVMGPKAAGAAGGAIGVTGGQSMDRGRRRPGPRLAPSVAPSVRYSADQWPATGHTKRPKENGRALPSRFVFREPSVRPAASSRAEPRGRQAPRSAKDQPQGPAPAPAAAWCPGLCRERRAKSPGSGRRRS